MKGVTSTETLCMWAMWESLQFFQLHSNTHMKEPTLERKHEYKQCEKAFSSNCLHIHERIHSGEKSYICNQCGKVFISHSSLRTHYRTHSR
jgi:KRAB domain-containing zinc finger protein